VQKERIPTEVDIRGWNALQPFVAKGVKIQGVYQNLDVDSVVFQYAPAADSEAEFWRQVRERSVAAGWVEDNETPSVRAVRVFQRSTRRREQEQSSSSEETRVAWTRDRVIVGYVQADHMGEPKPVREASEGKFAEKTIWPRFKALLPQ
jgi:hypothetical protein